MNLIAISPYPIPEEFKSKKVVNIGDGFILDGIERVLDQRFSGIYSSRVPLPDIREIFKRAKGIILAGANQLNDRYSILPDLSLETLSSIDTPIFPMAIGIHGEDGLNAGMSDKTKEVLRILHQRIEYSSWRCPLTIDYLKSNLPELQSQFLMTGCPVIYSPEILQMESFPDRIPRRVAVTVTDRGDFLAREKSLIDFVAREFPRVEKYLVFHQDFEPKSAFPNLREKARLLLSRGPYSDRVELRAHAVRNNFKLVIPPTYQAGLGFYENIDMHFGSRVHAHLYLLGRGRKSFLMPVDLRSVGFSKAFQFPIFEKPEELAGYTDIDFQPVIEAAQENFEVMKVFIKSMKGRLVSSQ